jgi:hypothetical protein
MKEVRVGLACVIALFLVLGGLLVAQDVKKEGRLRGQLPQNWSKLGLSDKQKQDTYAIQNKYDKEVDALMAQVRDLRAKEKIELDAILTADQKKRLREIITEKTPGASEAKKPDKADK